MNRQIPLDEGRRSFGSDPTSYHAARPPYPEAMYQTLVDRCHLQPGTSTFELALAPGLPPNAS